jgi:y4mF family transcriptional regulator
MSDSNMDAKEIGIIIKERRKHLGVNQQTLADLAGVGLNTLVAIERGEGNPQLSTLLTVLDTLGLQMNIKLKALDYETV